MSNFKSDLKAAEITEEDVVGMLGHSVVGAMKWEKVPDEIRECYDYSILTGRGANSYNYLFEVKDDLKSEETGNFAIEKYRRDKYTSEVHDSGILVTTADYWVIKIRSNGAAGVYMIPTGVIRHFINNEKKKECKWGGDDGRTKMYLFSIKLLEAYGLRLDTAPADSIVLRKFGRIVPPDRKHYV